MAAASPDLQGALQLVDQLDLALARMLPSVSGSGQGSQNGPPGLDEAKSAARAFAQAARHIELLLLSMRVRQPRTREEQLEEEIRQLEQELEHKDELMRKCQAKIQDWQQTCRELEAQHAKNLYSL